MKDCRNCVWLLHYYADEKVECIKEKFGLTPVADFQAREGCELRETSGDALARLEAEHERGAA